MPATRRILISPGSGLSRLEDMDNVPSPDVIAREIVEDLTAALVEFEAVAAALEAQLGQGAAGG